MRFDLEGRQPPQCQSAKDLGIKVISIQNISSINAKNCIIPRRMARFNKSTGLVVNEMGKGLPALFAVK
jgi:hypothetical protein